MLHIAIPALNEGQRLPACLNSLLQQLNAPEHQIWVCINQPDSWWQEPDYLAQCQNNLDTLHWLKQTHPQIRVLDYCSPGKGWPPGKDGIGRARSTLLRAILKEDSGPGIFLSLDADTLVPPDYLHDVSDRFARFPRAVGMAIPYHHPLGESVAEDRAILRYELYLRHYILCLLKINSPWAFTAIGSGMGARLEACRRIGGLTPKKSGEDFYFLQKLRKFGPLLLWLPSIIRPAGRFSDRVLFGTGPAMIKGNSGNWDSYPIYPSRFFREIQQTYRLFPALQRTEVELPMLHHCPKLLGKSPWDSIRSNHKDPARFLRACHEKMDALRLLQYLRIRQQADPGTAEEELRLGLQFYGPSEKTGIQQLAEISAEGGLLHAAFDKLDQFRNTLEALELEARRHHDHNIFEN